MIIKGVREEEIYTFVITNTNMPYDCDYNGYERGGLHVTINGDYLSNFRDMDHFNAFLKLRKFKEIKETPK